MSLTTDIVRSYRSPGKVVAQLFAAGQREDRALAILMAGCAIVFVSQWPVLARQAHLNGEELNVLLGGSLMAWIFIAPLVFYTIAFVVGVFLRMLTRRDHAYGARLSLFWALTASSPLILLHGLTKGFVGPSSALAMVGLLWMIVFIWFWIAGVRAVLRANK